MRTNGSIFILTAILFAGCGVMEESSIAPIEETEREVAAVEIEQTNPFGAPVPLQDTEHRLAFETVSDWAPTAEFEQRWAAGLEPWRILHCGESETTAEGTTAATGPTVMIQPGEDAPWVGGIVTFEQQPAWVLHRGTWTIVDETSSSVTMEEENYDATFHCRQARFEQPTPTEESYASWVYASTLLNPEEPVYVENDQPLSAHDQERLKTLRNGPWSRELVERLIEVGPSNHDGVWGDALAWAEASGEEELVYELYRRWRPVGYCSRDTRPQRTKRAFAEFCEETGRTRCSLVLMTQLLAYRIPRRSDMWIGGKPVSYESELDRLPDGLDVPRFLLGLLTDYPGTDGNGAASISPRFFALAIQNTRYAPALRTRLERWLADPELDTWNRNRIANTIFLYDVYADPTTEAAEHAERVAALDGTPEISRLLLSRVE